MTTEIDDDWPTIEDYDGWDNWETEDDTYDEMEETIPKLLEDPYVAEIHDTFMKLLAEEKKAQLEKDYQIAFELELKEGEEAVKASNEAVKAAKVSKKPVTSGKPSKKVHFDPKVNRTQNQKQKTFAHKFTQTD